MLRPALRVPLARAAGARALAGTFTPAASLDGREFDFVIVGAGTAGCRLAHRLTEQGRASVLLVEAGVESQPSIPGTELKVKSTPMTHLMLHRQPETDWNFRTAPQRHVFQDRTEPGVAPYCRGKGPGGSGAINFMMWVRGARHDFDTWARLGAEGWSYEDCLPYFIKAENVSEAMGDGLAADPEQRGTQGVTGISLAKTYRTDPIADGLLETMKSDGYQLGDYNDLRHSGAWGGRMQYSIRTGERSSPDAILRKRLEEGSAGGLTFATGGHAAGLVLADGGSRARGVQLLDGEGGSVKVFARKETILSSGVIGSPQLLMLSGIGPRDHLEALGISCSTNLPVGQNLSDHLYMCYRAVGGELLTEYGHYGPKDAGPSAQDVQTYAEKREGLLAKVMGETCGFTTPVGSRADGGPDLQCIGCVVPFGHDSWAHAMDSAAGKSGIVGDEHLPTLSIGWSVAQARSRGQVLLGSSDPRAAPIIDQRFYDDRVDQDLHVVAYRRAQEMLAKGPFKDSKPWLPEVRSDDDIRENLRVSSFHGWHGCGTCRMGQPDDPACVVDPKLRVRGVEGLRVCDVSVFPVVTSGNTNAPTVMVAEKGADIIKMDHAELFA